MKKQETPDFWELKPMTFSLDGVKKRCSCIDYIDAKTKDLQEFGYGSLDEKQTGDSLLRVLKNEPIKSNIIDQFILQDSPCFAS